MKQCLYGLVWETIHRNLIRKYRLCSGQNRSNTTASNYTRSEVCISRSVRGQSHVSIFDTPEDHITMKRKVGTVGGCPGSSTSFWECQNRKKYTTTEENSRQRSCGPMDVFDFRRQRGSLWVVLVLLAPEHVLFRFPLTRELRNSQHNAVPKHRMSY